MVYENLILNNPSNSSKYMKWLVTDYELERLNTLEGGNSFQ